MNWRKFLAVGTALAAVGAFTPTDLVQKCASMVFAVEESVVTVQPEFTYEKYVNGYDVEYNDDGSTKSTTPRYIIAITGFSDDAAGDIVIPDELGGLPVTTISWDFQYADFSSVRSVTVPKTLADGMEYIPAGVRVKLPEGCEHYAASGGVLYRISIYSESEEQPDGSYKTIVHKSASAIGFDGTAVGDVVVADEIGGVPVYGFERNFAYSDFSGVKSVTIPTNTPYTNHSTVTGIPVDVKLKKGCNAYTAKDGVIYSTETYTEYKTNDEGSSEELEKQRSFITRINSDAPENIVIPDDINGSPVIMFNSGVRFDGIKTVTLNNNIDELSNIPHSIDVIIPETNKAFVKKDGITYMILTKSEYVRDDKGEYVYDDDHNRVQVRTSFLTVETFDDTVKGDVVIPDKIDDMNVYGFDLHGTSWKKNVTSITLPKYLGYINTLSISDTCSYNIADGNEKFEIKDDFLIDKEGDYRYNYETYEYEKKSKAVKALKPLSGEVTIPEGIESIGALFRNNSDITVINIPASLTFIDNYFCAGMPSLTAINVDKENTRYFSVNGALGRRYTYDVYAGIDENTGNSKYVEIEQKDLLALPEGYEGAFTVDDGIKVRVCGLAFENCKKVSAVKLGKNVTFDYQFAGFVGCDSLTDLEINGDLDYFEKDWISSTPWYKSLANGAVYFGDKAVVIKNTDDEPLTVDIKDGTASIPWWAVIDGNIGTLNIPASLGIIGEYVLDHKSISAVNVDEGNKVYASADGVLFSKDMKTLKFYPQSKTDESYTIPDGTELLAAYAFAGNNYLRHVDIPESVEMIYGTNWGGAFANCKSLEEIKVPSKVKDMDWGELEGCKLKALDLPETMTCYTGHYGYDYSWDYEKQEYVKS
ncbi:MAG: leucine-rich repeat protein, partial [Ruminococcus sp.]|nr:leucine-rich repeat protein [Ruminococcus sp.]